MACLFCKTDPHCLCKKKRAKSRYVWLTVLLIYLEEYRAKHPNENQAAWLAAWNNATNEKRSIATLIDFAPIKKVKRLKITT